MVMAVQKRPPSKGVAKINVLGKLSRYGQCECIVKEVYYRSLDIGTPGGCSAT